MKLIPLLVLVWLAPAGEVPTEPIQKKNFEGKKSFPKGTFGKNPRLPTSFTTHAAPMLSKAQILVLSAARTELRLDKEQAKKIDDLLISWSKNEEDTVKKLDTVKSREEQRELAEGSQKNTLETWKQIREVLTPKQYTRLEQLELQKMGLRVFVFPPVEVAEKLKIDAKQKGEWRKIYGNWQNRYPLPRVGTKSWDKLMSAFLDVFSDEQKKQWRVLCGEPFDFQASPVGKGPRGVSLTFPNLGTDAALLRKDSIRKELRLTEVQTKAVVRFLDTWEERFEDVKNLIARPGAVKEPTELSKRMADLNDLAIETTDGIIKILTAEQKKRLGQLKLQNRGVLVFMEPAVSQELKLDRKQRDQLLVLYREWTESKKDSLEAARKLRQELMARALKNLSSGQRKTWQAMVGEPFDFFSDAPVRKEKSNDPGK